MSERLIPQRILVPTDFSDFAGSALDYAVHLAERFGAKLTVAFADEFVPPIDFIEAPASFYLDTLPETKRAVEDRLTQYVAEHVPAGLPCTAKVVVGAPVAAISGLAQSEDADLIVMGTHGRRGWRRLLLGSVTENVLRKVNRPVLTIRPAEVSRRIRPGVVERILCAVNKTDVAHRALGYAAAWADKLAAELVLVQIVEGTNSVHYLDRGTLNEWIGPALRDRYTYATFERSEYTSQQIINFAEEALADLIVIGAQHKRFLDTTVLGTTSERVTRYALSPVLTVLRPAEGNGRDAREADSETERHSSFPPVLTG